MNLYKISQDQNNGYDTYDSAVVAAESEEDARKMNPEGDYGFSRSWTEPRYVTVEYLGVAKVGTVAGFICSSYNAG